MDLTIDGVGLQRAKGTQDKSRAGPAPAPEALSSSAATGRATRAVRTAAAPRAVAPRPASAATTVRRTSPSFGKVRSTRAGTSPAGRLRPMTAPSADAALEGCLVENLKRQIRLLEQHVALLKSHAGANTRSTDQVTGASTHVAGVPAEPTAFNKADETEPMMVPPVAVPLASTALQRAFVPEPHHTEIASLEINLRALVTECGGLQDMCLYLNREKEVMGEEIVELRAALREAELTARSEHVVRDVALDELAKERSARQALEQSGHAAAAAACAPAPPPSLEDVTHQRDFYRIQAERLRATVAQQTAELELVQRALADEQQLVKDNETQLCVCMDRLEMLETRARTARAYYATLSQRFVVLASVVRKVTETDQDKPGFAEALAEVTEWEQVLETAPPPPVDAAAGDEEALPACFERTDQPPPAGCLAPLTPVTPVTPEETQGGTPSETAPEPVPDAQPTREATPQPLDAGTDTPPPEASPVAIATAPPEAPAVPETAAEADTNDGVEDAAENAQAAQTTPVAPEAEAVSDAASPEPVPSDVSVPTPLPEAVAVPPEAAPAVESPPTTSAPASPPTAPMEPAVDAIPPPPPPQDVAIPPPPPPQDVAIPPPPPPQDVAIPPPPPSSAVPLPPVPMMVCVPAATVPTPGGVPQAPAAPTLSERLSALDAQAAEEEKALAEFVRTHTTE